MLSAKSHFLYIKNKLFYFNPSVSDKLLPIKGRFSIGKDNNLIYLVTESSAWRRQYKIPGKIEFQGKWSLNNNYDLVLDLQDSQKLGKRKLVLKGKILDCQKNYLFFQTKTKSTGAKEAISFLKLRGFWQSDKFNRLTFEVTKKENPDTLAFKGLWSVNKNQKIIYLYQKTNLITKRKVFQKLVFDGFWQLSGKNRLRYVLAGSKGSFFDFRAYLQSNNLYPKKGAIKYRIGIGIKKGVGNYREKIISLYGTWKFSRRRGLSFESDYGEGKIRRIYFSAKINITKGKQIIFTLLGKDNKPIGASVTFKKQMFSKGDFEYFLRLKKEGKDYEVSAGLTLKF